MFCGLGVHFAGEVSVKGIECCDCLGTAANSFKVYSVSGVE